MHNSLLLSAIALTLIGCGGSGDRGDGAPGDSVPPAGVADQSATAIIRDSAGTALGTLHLRDDSGTIRVEGTLSGLAAGVHAIHIHEVGACTPTFEAAGAHWNPTDAHHGRDNPEGPHLGDMANVDVATDGTAQVHVTTSGGSLHGNPMALDADGASVVIHADPDDYTSDPSGASGARVGCGVITMP